MNIGFDRKNPFIKIHGMSKSPTYSVWVSMIQRCTNPNAHCYDQYGGAGRGVCKRWRIFTNFLKDMGVRPEGMTLERKNNDKGYCLENCRWATRKEQQNNRKDSRFLEFEGKKLTASQWSEITGLRELTIKGRIHRGWSVSNDTDYAGSL